MMMNQWMTTSRPIVVSLAVQLFPAWGHLHLLKLHLPAAPAWAGLISRISGDATQLFRSWVIARGGHSASAERPCCCLLYLNPLQILGYGVNLLESSKYCNKFNFVSRPILYFLSCADIFFRSNSHLKEKKSLRVRTSRHQIIKKKKKKKKLHTIYTNNNKNKN